MFSVYGVHFSMMKPNILKQTLNVIYDLLLKTYGPQECYLVHKNPFELLVATILSAQCTDKKVNSITPILFECYPTAEAMASADRQELENIIHPCGFFHAKAGNIIGAAQKITEKFGGQVPGNLEDLVSLPGVGRKTANVVLSDAFDVPGLPVDTHVKRLCNLIGIVQSDDAEAIEAVLCSALPPERWGQFSHLLIMHGRTRCPARRPACAACEIKHLCRYGKKTPCKP